MTQALTAWLHSCWHDVFLCGPKRHANYKHHVQHRILVEDRYGTHLLINTGYMLTRIIVRDSTFPS